MQQSTYTLMFQKYFAGQLIFNLLNRFRHILKSASNQLRVSDAVSASYTDFHPSLYKLHTMRLQSQPTQDVS